MTRREILRSTESLEMYLGLGVPFLWNIMYNGLSSEAKLIAFADDVASDLAKYLEKDQFYLR